MWVLPRARGLEPNYGSASLEAATGHNRWAHLAGDVLDRGAALVAINQDAHIWVVELDAHTTVPFELRAGRQLYFVCLEGAVEVGHGGGMSALEAYEAAEVRGQQQLQVSAQASRSHCLVVEMAASD